MTFAFSGLAPAVAIAVVRAPLELTAGSHPAVLAFAEAADRALAVAVAAAGAGDCLASRAAPALFARACAAAALAATGTMIWAGILLARVSFKSGGAYAYALHALAVALECVAAERCTCRKVARARVDRAGRRLPTHIAPA